MAPAPEMKRLLSRYYRCQFSEVFDIVRRCDEASHELHGIAANALLELHQIDAARAWLAAGMAAAKDGSASALHLIGRFHYLDRDYGAALTHFTASLDAAQTAQERLRAFFGLAHTAQVFGDREQAHYFARRIEAELGSGEPVDQICFDLLRGDLAIPSGDDDRAAEEHFKDAIGQATAQAWTYWLVRGVYGLAKCAKRRGDTPTIKAMLLILDGLLSGTECVFLRAMVNKEFVEELEPARGPMTLERTNRIVRINEQRIDLSDSPRLFDFLECLANRRDVVSKREISRRIWPDEAYKEDIHDRQIFNIVSRLRVLVERYEMQPTYLLSSRIGYRLSVDATIHA